MGSRPGTGPPPGDTAPPAPAPGSRKYSTGYLTAAQAATVTAWRRRLLSDQPRASASDTIAAATGHLLATSPPGPLQLAAYAYTAMHAREHRDHGHPQPGAPHRPAVTYYLPPALADQADQLRHDALKAARAELRRITGQARQAHRGNTPHAALNRTRHVLDALTAQGLHYTRAIPRGAIARYAIDHWANLDTDDVIRHAETWAQDHHTQQRRPRHDITLHTR